MQTILTQCPWFQTSPNQAVPTGCEQLKSLGILGPEEDFGSAGI